MTMTRCRGATTTSTPAPGGLRTRRAWPSWESTWPALSRPHVGDENALAAPRRRLELADVTPDDVQAPAAALYGEGGRIEIVRRP